MRKLILGVLTLVVVAIVAELGVAAYTEHRISRTLRESAELEADPHVILRGFPVLPDIISGKYSKIDIQAQRVSTDYAGRVSLEAALVGAEITPSAWYQRRITALHADELTGRVIMNQTELGQTFNIPDLRLSFFPPGIIDAFGTATQDELNLHRPVMMTATVPESTTNEPVTVEARLYLDGHELEVRPLRYYNGPERDREIPIPEELQDEVLRSFGMTITIPDVPFGLTPAVAYPQGGRIVVESTVANVTLDLDHRRASVGAANQ
ncbi:DUF2993 domain-containing protein [Hoyosella rhizosphaerae]|uniref:DUF2993 domain-containing protein n=1 Tax=Hoyosella rhizosphaerae TaxID=1755582 RepID=A0A916XHA4_9ACTN|nr:DUF2993 domain-containing protein [Hoyosella rhizosphaerae]MBN4928235.1 DUF2993 domain-containing protein [Hoyosella rhizosphaerae]GGC73427.1 hypothetical protein GCM10011410_28220 [Hoyosella rhizosphaerae]